MTKNFVSSLKASSAVSLIATLVLSYVLAGTSTYNVTPEELAALKYYDAIKLIQSRTQTTTGFSALFYTATSPSFLLTLLGVWASLTALCMSAFLVFFRIRPQVAT